MVFFPTNNCNLRCLYCYASAGEKDINKSLDIEIAKYSVDFIINNAIETQKKKVIIKFHGGGEPFMSFDFIKRITKYANSQAERNNLFVSKISASTNGVLTNSKRNWIVEHMTDIQVSMDGPRTIQNFQRPSIKKNMDVFEEVMKTLNYFDRNGFKYKIKITLTDNSIRRFDDFVEFIFYNTNCRKIHVETLNSFGRSIKNKINSPRYPELYYKWIKVKEFANKNNIELYSSEFSENYDKSIFCGATLNNFIVTYEGLISSCFKISSLNHNLSKFFIIGKYEKNSKSFIFDWKKIKYLQTLNYSPDGCSKCPSFKSCNNRCLADYLLNNNLKREKKEEMFCDLRIKAAQRSLPSFLL